MHSKSRVIIKLLLKPFDIRILYYIKGIRGKIYLKIEEMLFEEMDIIPYLAIRDVKVWTYIIF
jgi:hypothetical protein